MRVIKKLICIILLTCLVIGCHSNDKSSTNKKNIIIARLSPITRTLFFEGIINPISMVNVTAPTDGMVKKINFRFGQWVKKGQSLLTIKTTKLDDDLSQTLAEFLKAKATYRNNKIKWQGTQELERYGLIPKNEYISDKANLYDSELNLKQARRKLLKLLKKSTKKQINLDKLNIEDIENKNNKLDIDFSIIEVNAPRSGIVLHPVTSDNDSEDKNILENVTPGTLVKEEQILLSIGDMSGITLDLNVNEINIQQIKIGAPVTITGVAFPGISLKGQVVAIDDQAQKKDENIPMFPVQVSVKQLTSQQRKKLRVGMSAKVAMELQEGKKIQIPIKAISEDNGRTFVNRINNKTNKVERVPVMTGKTSMDTITVETGIKPGDKIVIPN